LTGEGEPVPIAIGIAPLLLFFMLRSSTGAGFRCCCCSPVAPPVLPQLYKCLINRILQLGCCSPGALLLLLCCLFAVVCCSPVAPWLLPGCSCGALLLLLWCSFVALVLWFALGCGAPLLLVGSNLTLPQPYLNLNLTATNPQHLYLLSTDVILRRSGNRLRPGNLTYPTDFQPLLLLVSCFSPLNSTARNKKRLLIIDR
jgi:hypothetical protein